MKKDQELIDVLTQIVEQLSESDDTPWSGLKIDEINSMISNEINRLKSGQKVDIRRLKGFFVPTGPIQEISIDNGWGDVFISLANRFDSATLWRS
jgi:hypothetical protein